jgi:thiol:disulfide interchange protein DsbD
MRMKMRSRLVNLVSIAMAVGLVAAGAYAQTANMPAAETLVKVAAVPVAVAAGGTATANIQLTILPTWHVNANPPAESYNIPTRIKLTGTNGLTPGRVHYPPGKQEKFSFEDKPLLVYDGTVQVSVPISAAADAKSATLAGEVEYQSCNNEVCLAPVSVPFTVKVDVTPAGATSGTPTPDTSHAGANPQAFSTFDVAPVNPTAAAAPPRTSGNAVRDRLESALAGGGIGWLLALFVGGLLLNLTPCVFPMLGITVSIFGVRRKEPVPKIVATAVLYVLGICLTYTVLGVVAALTGGLFGAALQSPWVPVFLGGLLLLLSGGMFGAYEMNPPTWLMDRLGGAQATNLAGAFVAGLGVGIIAAPCVGPFVVAVLALIAQKADVGFGVSTMFTLSLGLGFPYLLLATFSNLLQTLPRSGDWMVWVKHGLGVLLVGFGLYYLCVGLAPDLVAWVPPVTLTLGGLWLGFIDKSAGTRGAFHRFAIIVGSVALFSGVYEGSQLYRKQQHTLTFKPYDAAAVQASVAAGRPVLMDFSADWCLPCHEMELNTFTDPRVVASAKRFDRYKVDLTKYDSPEASALRKKYSVTGVPIVVFLGRGGSEVAEARVDGFLPPERFLQQLELGAAR